MSDLICPFNATLAKHDFGCQYADQIVRRGGAEVACKSESQHRDCVLLHEKIKSKSLDSMGLDDDLLSLPHSVMVKIQFGALLALQKITGTAATEVENIADLIVTVRRLYPDPDLLPFDSIGAEITNYKIARRGRK